MIRLYGTSRGHGSFARVTGGMRNALKDLGALAGFVPVDAYDMDESYDGWQADVAVFVGDPRSVDLMMTIGQHERRFVLLPPNSTWMPQGLLAHVADYATHLLAPSLWAAEVQRRYAKDVSLGVSLWRHGVSQTFYPIWNGGHSAEFCALHLSSTTGERKGTRELVEGWCQAVAAGWLGRRPKLTMVMNRIIPFPVERVEDGTWATVHQIERDGGYSLPEMAALYRAQSLVVQPSRGEGFGLPGLEALCCGVPVVITDCTGHGEYVRRGEPGVVVVPTGELAPIDDGPGALAPSLQAADIADALRVAHENWSLLLGQARGHAQRRRDQWSWKHVTEDWLVREKIT